MTQPSVAKNPWVGFTFVVEIDGIQDARFTECSGFEAKVEVEEYREGGLNDYTHRLPGRRSFSTVTLKRGMVDSVELFDWLKRLAQKSDKTSETKNLSIVLYSLNATEAMRWNLVGAFPVKWSSPAMQTDQSGVLFESLELAFQELTFEKR